MNSDWPPVLQVSDFHFILVLLCWRVSLVVNSLKPFHWGCEYMNLRLRWKFCQIHQLWMVQQSPTPKLLRVAMQMENFLKYIFYFYFKWLILIDMLVFCAWHFFLLQLDGKASNVVSGAGEWRSADVTGTVRPCGVLACFFSGGLTHTDSLYTGPVFCVDEFADWCNLRGSTPSHPDFLV